MKKKSFMYNTLLMTGANAITRATGFFYRIYLSRRIGAEGLGLYGLVTPIYTICCAVVASGLPVAAMKTISECHAEGDRPRAKSATIMSLFLVMALSLPLFLIVFCGASPLSHILGDSRTKPSLTILAFAILITGFENIYKSSFYSEGRAALPAVAEISEQLFRILLVIALLSTVAKSDITRSSAILSFGTFAGEVLSLIVLSAAYAHHTKRQKYRLERRLIGELSKTAAPVTLARTAETILSSGCNILVPLLFTLYGFSNREALSLLGVISGMVMPLLFLPYLFTNALCVNLVPFVSANLAKGNHGAVLHKAEQCLVITALCTFPSAAILCIYASPIATRLFADSRVALFLPPMAIGGVLSTFRHILTALMNACGKAKTASLHSFLGNVAELVLLCLLVPRFGAFGYIASYIISNAVLLFPSAVTTAVALHLDMAVLKKTLLPLLPTAAAFLFVIPFTRSPHLSFLLFSGLAASSIYLIGAYFLCFEKKIIFFSKIP